MGVFDIFITEFKSGYLGLYAGWIAIPTSLLIITSSILALVFHFNVVGAITGFAIFILLLLLELPILSSFIKETTVIGRFVYFIRHPVSKAFLYIAFSFVLWITTQSLISFQSLAALFMSLTAALYLSAGLKKESIIDRYISFDILAN